MKKLVIIADYCYDGLATNEVVIAVQVLIKKTFKKIIIPVTPFNTIHTTFAAYQLLKNIPPNKGKDYIFFLNTDPRTQTKNKIQQAKGANFIRVITDNNVSVVGPNAGYSFSLLKEQAKKVQSVSVSNKGSQFRSRDVFAKAIANLFQKSAAPVKYKDISKNVIPDMPKECIVLHTDNYGNIKTSITRDHLKKLGIGLGTKIKVTIESKIDSQKKAVNTVKTTDNMFGEKPGTLVLAPGSSGERENTYWELIVRFANDYKDSGSKRFNFPEPGDKIILNK